MAHCGDAHLPFRSRGASRGADFSVRPRLRREPVERVFAVRPRCSQYVVVALGEKMPALVLEHIRIPALDRFEDAAHVRGHAVAHVPEVEVVGRAHPDGGYFAAGVLRPVDICGQPHPVAHGHHHLAVNDGHGLEFLLQFLALFFLFRGERPLLRDHGRDHTGPCGQHRPECPDHSHAHELAPLLKTAAGLSTKKPRAQRPRLRRDGSLRCAAIDFSRRSRQHRARCGHGAGSRVK